MEEPRDNHQVIIIFMQAYRALIKLFSTFFYVGYLPLPGTAASIAGALIFYFFCGDARLCFFLAFLFIILGFMVAGPAERIFQRKDAQCVVIDEVAGIFISLIFIPCDNRLIIIAFILFRIFDVLKPYPIARLQRLGGSLGIMCDDIIAAIYTNVVIFIAFRFLPLVVS